MRAGAVDSISSMTDSAWFIPEFLKGADLSSASSKKVRAHLNEKFKCDFSNRKHEIDKVVMEVLTELEGDEKKDSEEDDDEPEEDSGDNYSEEEKPKTRKPPARKPAPKKKRAKGSDSDEESEEPSDEDDSVSSLTCEFPRKLLIKL